MLISKFPVKKLTLRGNKVFFFFFFVEEENYRKPPSFPGSTENDSKN